MPDRSRAARIAMAPSFGAASGASPPRNAPIGVRAAPTITTSLIVVLQESLRDMLAVRADLVAQRAELAHAIAQCGEVRIEQLDEAWQDVAIGTVPLVHALELEHLLKRETKHLELADVLEAANVVVGVDAHAAVETLHRFEQTKLLVVADRPLGQPHLRRQLPDAISPEGRRHAASPQSAFASSRQLAASSISRRGPAVRRLLGVQPRLQLFEVVDPSG